MNPRHSWTRGLCAFLALALIAGAAACAPAWRLAVARPDGEALQVDAVAFKGLADYAETVDKAQAVPLERLLAQAGYTALDSVTVVESGGAAHSFAWGEMAGDAWLLGSGQVRVGEQAWTAARVEAAPSPLANRVQAHLVDVAPTIAAALGLPAPAQATGQALPAPAAPHAVLVVLDGFGYVRYGEALQSGLIPNLAALGEPLLGVAAYQPITPVSTATLLTGASPSVHGVDRRGIRKTETETLFDVAAAAGRRVVAVEGESLALNLPSAEMQLSGDRDGNGSTDDNVLANALAVVQVGMPDLLFVHWHGIDDTGHTYGPGAPEEVACIRQVDAGLGTLLDALPQGTLVVVVADHGMHVVQEDGRQGNHGNLVERDMFAPIWITAK